MNLKVGVIGGGSWGTTVASLVAQNASTKLWARDEETIKEINKFHSNEKYLPQAKLNSALKASFFIKEVVSDADVIVMAIPTQYFRQVLEEAKPFIRPWIPIVSLSKGLERGTNLRMTEIIETVLPEHPVGVLTGPNLAREIIKGQPAASVIAIKDTKIAMTLQKLFNTGLFRVYINDDIIGCELGGALKNVIAIAAGIGDGAGAGVNTRAAVITRGLAELTRLGIKMGGKPSTFAGLTGMGDLVATCISPMSRNRYVGMELGKGRKLQEIISEMSMVAEGVKTCSAVIELAKKYNIAMPISQEVYKVINEGNTIEDAFKGVLNHEIKTEAEPG